MSPSTKSDTTTVSLIPALLLVTVIADATGAVHVSSAAKELFGTKNVFIIIQITIIIPNTFSFIILPPFKKMIVLQV